MDISVFWAFLIAFALTAAMGPFVIPFLHKIKVGQTVRDDGPESHLKKTGTPTMGGVMIIIGMMLPTLFFVRSYPDVIPVLLMTVGFAVIGFIDDYIKVVLKRAMGLRAWEKLSMQFVVTAAFAFYMTRVAGVSLDIIIPFTGGMTVDPGIFSIPLLFLAVLGTVNGANFTDGLDGLASSVTAVIAAFFGIIAYMGGYGVTPAAFAMVGSLLAFLLYNVHPASVFMGDTGSLALGGFVVSAAYMLNMPVFILIVAFIYLAEVMSVIIQVSYFKMSGGKRVFKMAPIHHHFELCGWSETRVVGIFTIITIILAVVGFMAY
ncbi:MAG: phospho-N-acetylmuramoyl-pentapeptide-transferase [Lachnospiraceae bacterium]|nr:phospho-N-acetylmuramoyl-pentapeptide-transferase [Lachnospiraceae bacterium]MBR6470031.1 phospho-N-acetylmuramoyl-pentapeptide-transferase [Lachnospiraceae bacterium]